MPTRSAILFLVLGSAAACHTPQWRVEQIHEEIDAVNTPRRDAAVKSALEANHATLANVTPTTVVFRSDMNQCVDAEVLVETADKQVFVAPCNALRNALFTAGAIEVKSEDGSSLRVLVAAQPLAGDHSSDFVVANGANGELYLVRAHMNVVRKRKIWHAGTCNFMPSPVHVMPSVTMFVLPSAVVRAIDVTYEGEDTDVVCDERVE